MAEIWRWVLFNAFVLAMLALDLFVFHREAHRVRVREAAGWSAVWIGLAVAFGAGIYVVMGSDAGARFFTGYLVEKALSVDNIFVFVLIFSYFQVPPQYQHRVLFWGILGALVMRGVMIGAGAYLVSRFHWILYVFGAFLVVTGIRMATQSEHQIEVESNPSLRLMRRIVPITDLYHGPRFLVRPDELHEGDTVQARTRARWIATPLLVVLVLVETTDVVFALDSIPAIFTITQDPFLVYTSNIFAILGLRSLYFLLAGVVHKFHYLKLGLSAVLVLIGLKMLVEEIYEVPIGLSLGVVAAILALSVIASLIWPKKVAAHDPAPHDPLAERPEPARAPIPHEPEESPT